MHLLFNFYMYVIAHDIYLDVTSFDFTSHDLPPPHTHTHTHMQSEDAVSEGGLCDDPVQSYEEATKLRLPLWSSLPVHLHPSLDHIHHTLTDWPELKSGEEG